MKNKRIAIAISVFLPSLAAAQSFEWGLEAGIATGRHKVRSRGNIGEGFSVSRDMNFRAGIPMHLSLSKQIKLHSGVFYNTKGSRKPILGLLPGDGGILYYGCAELPLILTYEYQSKGAQRFFIGAGPYAGIGIHGVKRGKDQRPLMSYLDTKKRMRWGNELGNDMQRMQWGIQAQAGCILPSGILMKIMFQSAADAAPEENKRARQGIIEVSSLTYTTVTVGYIFHRNTPKKSAR